MSASKDKNKPGGAAPPKKPLPAWFNFTNAGLSGCYATAIVHPMDVMKNRMQMSKEGTTMLKTASALYNEGILKFYAGLGAGFLRQLTYTTARLGIYNQLRDIHGQMYPGEAPTFIMSALMAATAGSCGAFVGTPAEVILVRMSSDGRLPPEQRRNYTSLANALSRIVREEGLTTLWRGTVATVGRAIIVNVSQLATYSQAKLLIATNLDMKEGVPLHFCAAMTSGLITSINSMPFDIAKTRIQNMKSSSGGGKLPGMLSVIASIAKNESVFALWKGFFPYYSRVGPHTVITFIFNEQMANLYRAYFAN